jgi:COP9 signalosome complex subunit 4
MASPALLEVLKSTASSDRASVYVSALKDIKQLSVPDRVEADLSTIIDGVFSDNLGIVSTRTCLVTFIETLKQLGNDDLTIAAGSHALGLINTSSGSQSSASYVDQIATLRTLVATAYEHNEDFLEAATTLAEIPLDTSQRKVSDEDKAAIWVRIVRNYLEVDDSTAAETYLNKLKTVILDITDPELRLHFQLSQARIQDSKREFLIAAQAYAELSNSQVIAEEERLHTLSMAIKCAILAPAGPPRNRVLGRLYKDERSAGLEEFGILEKMFLDRLIAPAEVEKFAQGLSPHQLATTADGSTVLAKAVVEHNLLATSRLYSNIDFEALGILLGLNADKAETTTARMIEQGRLVGRIDQIEQTIWFEPGDASSMTGTGRAEVLVGKEIRRWDASTQALMEEVESITNMMQQEFPVSQAHQTDGAAAHELIPTQEFVDHYLAT